MNKIIFATNNRHKLQEVSSMLNGLFDIVGLADMGFDADIPETADTLEGNALMKAEYINRHLRVNCFADDTGLEVEALDGEPGVISARYAGEPSCSERNIDKLLSKLEGIENRNARFRTVIALIDENGTHFFEGIVKGVIIDERRGEKGFGYDPVFVPDGYSTTFAQMSEEDKNRISHRGRAIEKLVRFLRDKQN